MYYESLYIYIQICIHISVRGGGWHAPGILCRFLHLFLTIFACNTPCFIRVPVH